MKVNSLMPKPVRAAVQFIQAITDNKIDNPMIKPSAELILPWPDKSLSPNARVHWAQRARATKSARREAFILARKAGWTQGYLPVINAQSIDYLTARYDLHIDFYPPNRCRRDDDNLIAAFKPYRDGIAQALEVDDFRFRSIIRLQQQVIKGGQVRVRLG